MGGYYNPYQGSDRITDLMQQRGQIAAQGAARSGEIWGNAIGNIGQIAGQYGQQYAEQQKQKQAVAQMAKRDAAWVAYVDSGEWAKDPQSAYKASLRVWGPEKGPQQFQALQGVANLMNPKVDEEKAMKSAGHIIQGMGALGDEARAVLYPNARAIVSNVPWLQGYELPEQYDPKVWAEKIDPLAPVLLGNKPTAPIEVSPGATLYDPEKGAAIYQAPPSEKAPAKHMVTTVGPNGQPVQRLATEEELAAGVPAYREPKSAQRDNEPLMAVMGDDGVPTYVPRSQAIGKRPASTREQGRAVTSGDAARIAELDTSLDDLAVLRGTVTGNQATGASAKAGAMLPNVISEMTGWGVEAKQKQAAIDRVKQVIGKALEGGVLRKEDEQKYEKILPTIGDPPAVVETKLAGLERAIALRRERELEARADAGYDVTRFVARRPNGAAPPATLSVPGAPPVGSIVRGYRYKGGNPADPGSWEKP